MKRRHTNNFNHKLSFSKISHSFTIHDQSHMIRQTLKYQSYLGTNSKLYQTTRSYENITNIKLTVMASPSFPSCSFEKSFRSFSFWLPYFHLEAFLENIFLKDSVHLHHTAQDSQVRFHIHKFVCHSIGIKRKCNSGSMSRYIKRSIR